MATATVSTAESTPHDVATATKLYEIVGGIIVEKPPMGAYEGMIATALAAALHAFVTPRGLGQVASEVLFIINRSAKLRRRPDVAFVSEARWPQDRPIGRVDAWDVIPDLMVEVISATNSADEVVDKVAEYFRAGVRLVWIVYPSQHLVYCYASPKQIVVLDIAEELDGREVVPGFRMPIQALFGPRPS
jgi:Uma2 family endonuclease